MPHQARLDAALHRIMVRGTNKKDAYLTRTCTATALEDS